MISMVDALIGLYKWKPLSDQALRSRTNLTLTGIAHWELEAVMKYYYYLGACNAFVIAELKKSMKDTMDSIGAKQRWLRRVDNEL